MIEVLHFLCHYYNKQTWGNSIFLFYFDSNIWINIFLNIVSHLLSDIICFFFKFFLLTSENDFKHTVIILNRGSIPPKRTGRKWWNYSRPQCAAWRHSTLRAHWLMALLGGGGGRGVCLREKYVFCFHRELQRLLSLFCLCEEVLAEL